MAAFVAGIICGSIGAFLVLCFFIGANHGRG